MSFQATIPTLASEQCSLNVNINITMNRHPYTKTINNKEFHGENYIENTQIKIKNT